MTPVAYRDVDKLDAVPDGTIMKQDQEYLVKHNLNELFSELMSAILREKPADPLQYIIDSLSLGSEHAAQGLLKTGPENFVLLENTNAVQDIETGLPQHRKEKLLQVFKIIDQDGTGKISLRMLQAYASKHGGETLTLEDLKGLFKDFKPSNENYINQQEFLHFFSKVSHTITNREFEEMIKEMQG